MDSSTAASAENTGSPPPRGRNSSNLYLVTFLATLFLLLFISCAIVLRSYFVRRRYQRQVALALAQGIVLTPRAPGSRKKRFGVRPHMYESWIAPLHVSGVSGSHVSKPQGGRWCDMLPLTLQTVVVKRRTKDPNATSPLSSSVEPNAAPSPLFVFPPAGGDTSNGVRFSETVTPIETAPPATHFRSLLSRGLSFFPSGSSASNGSHMPQQIRSGQLEVPHPNSTPLPGQEPPPRSAAAEGLVPPNTISLNRERRESATWRAIVSPSPSLANAFTSEQQQQQEPQIDHHRQSVSFSGPTATGRPRLTLPVPTITTTLGGGSPNPDSAFAGSPVTPGPVSAVGGAATKYRIRTEMLQVSVLVSMPDIRMSTLYGDAGVVKRLRAAELGGWGYRGPKLEEEGEGEDVGGKVACDDSKRKKREDQAKVRQKEDEDADEVVEVPGDESSSSEEDEEDEDEEEEEHVPLPELVLGVLRLNYKHGNSAGRSSPTDRAPPTFVIPSSPPPPPPVPIPVPTTVFESSPVPESLPQEGELSSQAQAAQTGSSSDAQVPR